MDRLLVVALLLAASACSTSGSSELARLAEAPPLGYSVLLSGGAFVELETQRGGIAEYARTWPSAASGAEAFPLALAAAALASGRAFVRVEHDSSPSEARHALAWLPEGVPQAGGSAQAILARARERGHDLVLVVERLRDGAIERRGINDQWPITAMTWLIIGLGMLIPDHSYESRASLRVALREVHSGQIVYEVPLNGGPVDLSLVERGSTLGILSSILIPPFWVADDEPAVVAAVRELTTRRLMAELVRQMKSFELKERIRDRMPVSIAVTRDRGGARVTIVSLESVGLVRLRIDGQAPDEAAARRFEHDLLASGRQQDRWTYEAVLPVHGGKLLQVIVQTVAGRVVSVTAPLDEGT